MAHTARLTGVRSCVCVCSHTVYRGGARGGGWAETNRKQAFFIRTSILNACLTYEAWFGGYPYSNGSPFSFFTGVAFCVPTAILICHEFSFHVAACLLAPTWIRVAERYRGRSSFPPSLPSFCNLTSCAFLILSSCSHYFGDKSVLYKLASSFFRICFLPFRFLFFFFFFFYEFY